MVEQNKLFSIFMYKYMEKMNCGSVSKTATEFGVSRQQFYKWINGGIPSHKQLRNICTVISKVCNIDLEVVARECTNILYSSLIKENPKH